MARETRDGVVLDEVDGVRAVWPEGRRTGEPAAALSFRVGQADETLQTRGVTHLLEHLALVRTGQAPHSYNGRTGPTLTTFGMQGTAADLVGFFATLGGSLQDLPLDRLDLERGVLATEERGSGGGFDNLWRLRWGPREYGLMGYEEYGAQRVPGDVLRAWSARWFTRQNALLTLNGPPPRGFRLSLPEGSWCPPPEPRPAIDPLPMSFVMQGEWFGLSLLRQRRPGGNESAWLVSERLNQRLRFELGLVYGVQGGSAALTPSWRHDVFWTHALAEKLTAAGSALVDVLGELTAPMTEPERAQWAALRTRMTEQRGSREARTAYLSYVAEETLLGGTVLSKDELTASSDGVTEADVLSNVAASLSTLVLALPQGVESSPVATPIAQHSTSAVSGRTVAPAHGQEEDLVLADEGLSVVQRSSGKPVTVRFDELAGVLAWDDGARTLLGNDGFAVAYRPEMWDAKAGEVIAHIDSRVGTGLVIGQGARTPRPRPEPPPAEVARGFSAMSLTWRVWFVLRCFVGFVTLVSAVSTIVSPDPTQTAGDQAGTTAMLLLFTAFIVWPQARWTYRRARRRRT